MNKKCQIFKDQIYQILNKSELPPMVAYSLLLNILYELEKICNEVLIKEKEDNMEKVQEYDISLPKPENQDQPQS